MLLFQALNYLQEPSIARLPAQEPAPSRNDGPRVNHQINVPEVRLVREDGSMVSKPLHDMYPFMDEKTFQKYLPDDLKTGPKS